MQSDGPLFRNRLANILARMGSPHDNEALTAARMACAMVSEAGLTFQTLLASAPPRISLEPVDPLEMLVADPRRRRRPVWPPIVTWRNSMWTAVRQRWGTQAQQEYFTKQLQAGHVDDLWLPDWPTAQAILNACKVRDRRANGARP